jgi:hypothetical protein
MSSGWTPGPDEVSHDHDWPDLAPGWVTPVGAPWPATPREPAKAGLTHNAHAEPPAHAAVIDPPEKAPSSPGSGPFQVHHSHASPLAAQKPPVASQARPPASQAHPHAFQIRPAASRPRPLVHAAGPLAPLPGLLAPPHAPRPPWRLAYPRAITRHAIVLGGVGAAVIAAAAAVMIAIFGSGASGGQANPGLQARAHDLTLPHTVAGYVRSQEGSKEMLTSSAHIVSGVVAGVYQRSAAAQPGVAGVTSGMIAIDVGRISRVSPAGAIAGIYGGVKAQVDRASGGRAVVGSMESFPAGPLGGEVRCWNVTAPSTTNSGGSAGASCLWAGNGTFGYLFAPGMRTASLASALLTFRSVIEKPAH